MSDSFPTPPQIEQAQRQVLSALAAVEKRELSPDAPWQEIEKALIKVLGGPFQPQVPEHQVLALGVAGVLAERLNKETKAFWFPNRDAPEGASLGFPEALMVLSPFGAVMDALGRANLAHLDAVVNDLRKTLAQVKFSVQGGQAHLTALDYQRLFDPGFIQFTVLDQAKAKNAWESTPGNISRDVRDALGRAKLPAEVRSQFETQLVGSLQRMDPAKKLGDQAASAPRVVEILAHLYASVDVTGSAPEEFWYEIALPLLHIGNPTAFPALEAEELEAVNKGVDPLLLFLDIVPHQHPSDDQALLGLFPPSELSALSDALAKSGPLHLIQVGHEKLSPLIDAFDPQKTLSTLARFEAHVKSAAKKDVQNGAEAKQLLDGAIALLSDLKRAHQSAKDKRGKLSVRRLTEAEASSEPAIAVIRQAMQGPRLILTT